MTDFLQRVQGRIGRGHPRAHIGAGQNDLLDRLVQRFQASPECRPYRSYFKAISRPFNVFENIDAGVSLVTGSLRLVRRGTDRSSRVPRVSAAYSLRRPLPAAAAWFCSSRRSSLQLFNGARGTAGRARECRRRRCLYWPRKTCRSRERSSPRKIALCVCMPHLAVAVSKFAVEYLKGCVWVL